MRRSHSVSLRLALILGLFLLPGAAFAQGAVSGGLRGMVVDADLGIPIGGARVTLIEAGIGAQSTAEGSFLIQGVPPGRYTVSFAKDGYERKIVPDVVIALGQLADLRVELSPQVVEMEELIVTGSDLIEGEVGLLEIRAESNVVQDSISYDLIKKAGASDVAGALKLVVGASVVGGKYATVRGLSDRYTGTTLNSVRVPSADPRKRAVQVDLFPTETIENVTVTKTFTPDLQGDFTGGGVDIRTKSVPEAYFLSVGIGGEYNSLATGNEQFLSYRGGGVSATGFAGSDRELPAIASVIPPKNLSGIRYTATPTPEDQAAAEFYDQLTRSFAPAMGIDETAPGPNYGFSVSSGSRFTTDGGDVLGVVGALTYAHKYDFYGDGVDQRAAKNVESPLEITRSRIEDKGSDELLIGALGTFVWKPSDRNDLTFRLIANQSAQDDARFQQDPGADEQNQSLQYTQRTVASAQLAGNHLFGDKPASGFGQVMLDWVAAYNITRQWEPDVRFFRNVVDPATGNANKPSNSTDAENIRRIFRDIHEKNDQAQANVALPFVLAKGEGKIKTGLYGESTHRELVQDSFSYRFQTQYRRTQPGGACNESRGIFIASSPEDLWTDVFTDYGRAGLAPPEVICPELGQTTVSPTPAPNQLLWAAYPLDDDVGFDGDQKINAAYAMAEVPILSNLRFTGGARRESTKIDILPNAELGVPIVKTVVTTDDSTGEITIGRDVLLVTPEEASAHIDNSEWLPSLGLVWEARPGMNVRGSWTRTIARPTFRELAPVLTEEFLQGDEFLGNPELQLSRITNYDLRWEWFPKPGQVLAASVFYKELQNPIEYISFTLFGSRTFIQPVNYETGTLRGWEVEARSPLDDWLPNFRGLAVGANFTYLSSAVDVPAFEQQSLSSFDLAQSERELQGQPEYLFNLNATYDNPDRGTSAGIFYTRTGDTLLSGAAVGENGTPNVYELEHANLDLTFSQRLSKKTPATTLTVRLRNILGGGEQTVYRTPQGEEATKYARESARLFGAAFNWRW